jgi:hypothetical protein
MMTMHNREGVHDNTVRQYWASLLLLVVVTVLVYAVSLSNGFVRDDELIIVNNPQTLSLGNVPEVLLAPDVIKPYYRPLNRATYLLDYQIAGMKPAWYHAINILFHLGNVLLLYLVCLRLFPSRSAALIAALLFAVHPANSEAVNFISARNTILALFFSLASLLTFMRARDQGKQWPFFSAILFFCGLLSKETAFMLIGILILYTIIPLPGQGEREQGPRRFVTLLPYLAAMLVYFAMRAYALHDLVGAGIPASGLISRLSRNITIIPQYLLLLFFPVDLTIYHTAVPHSGIFALPGSIIVFWIVFLAALWLLFRTGNGTVRFGLVWCAVNYVPIANIIPIPADPITERFLYMPAAGFCIVVGGVLSGLTMRKGWKPFYWIPIAMILLVFAGLTVHRSLVWKDEMTLNSSGVRNNPSSVSAHYNLGTTLRDRGDLAGAVREWQRALQLDPAHSDSLIQMGTFYALQGDLGEAEKYYTDALNAPSGVADPEKSMAYYNLAKIREKEGRPQEAIEYYAIFLKLAPIQYEEYREPAKQRIADLSAQGAGRRVR